MRGTTSLAFLLLFWDAPVKGLPAPHSCHKDHISETSSHRFLTLEYSPGVRLHLEILEQYRYVLAGGVVGLHGGGVCAG
mgnify:CR=1 FL=1